MGISSQVQNFFENKNVLVIGTSQTLRSTLKKVFFELGAELSKIEFFEGSAQESIERLVESQAKIIVTPDRIEQKTALDLYELHSQIYPRRLECAFFVVSFKSQHDCGFLPLDYDIDGLLQLPASKEQIGSKILQSLSQKISPTPFVREKEKIEILMKQNKIRQAAELIDALFMLENSQFEEVFYLKGLCALKLAKYSEALEFFDDSLELSPAYYKALSGKSAVLIKQGKWSKAYKVNQKLLQLYPLNPDRIPLFMKVALINKKFEDCLELYELYQKTDERGPKVQKQMAAALALSGKYLLERGDESKALLAVKKCAPIARGSLDITHTLVSSLLHHGRYTHAHNVLYDIPSELQATTKFKFIELELLSHSANFAQEALVIGLDLLQQGCKYFTLYDTVLKLTKKLQRNPASLKEIISDASHKYPKHAEYFKAYIN